MPGDSQTGALLIEAEARGRGDEEEEGERKGRKLRRSGTAPEQGMEAADAGDGARRSLVTATLRHAVEQERPGPRPSSS